MSIGLSVAMKAVPFLDLLDQEQEELVAQVLESPDEQSANAVMESTRRRLSVAVDSFVRSLPTVVRNDAATSRAAAYALVGLADERIIHHPAGGLSRWGEKLLEFELYGSALAGQEIVTRARVAASGSTGVSSALGGEGGDPGMLAPLYLAIFRAGFEGSLRGDTIGSTSLLAALEEFVGASRGRTTDAVVGQRPSRVGLAPLPIAIIGVISWLFSGVAVWALFMSEPLADAARLTDRVTRGLPVELGTGDLERSVGPSGLPPLSGLQGRFHEQQATRDEASSAVPGYRSTRRIEQESGGASWLDSSSSTWNQASPLESRGSTAGSTAARSSLAASSGASGISLAALPPNLFTVMLVAYQSEQAMNQFLNSRGIRGLPVVVVEYDSTLYHILLSGIHATRDEADRAALRAAESYDGVSPWIQPLGELQAAVARAEQLQNR